MSLVIWYLSKYITWPKLTFKSKFKALLAKTSFLKYLDGTNNLRGGMAMTLECFDKNN